MANIGRVQLIYVIAAPEDLVEEGDRLFASHAQWMERTHYREGEKALIGYNVSKAAEPSNLWNEAEGSTGRTVFVLNEIYETEAGVVDHRQQAEESWDEWEAYVEWMLACDVRGVGSARIAHSLW